MHHVGPTTDSPLFNKSILGEFKAQVNRVADATGKAKKLIEKEQRKLEKAARMAAVRAKALADGYEEIGEPSTPPSPKPQKVTAYALNAQFASAAATETASAAPAPGPAAGKEDSALIQKSFIHRFDNFFGLPQA